MDKLKTSPIIFLCSNTFLTLIAKSLIFTVYDILLNLNKSKQLIVWIIIEDWGRQQYWVPLDRNTYWLDSFTDKYTYTFCKRDSLIPAVNDNFTVRGIHRIFIATWDGEDLCDCLCGLVKVVVHDSHYTVCLITGVEIWSRRRCSWPRGENADGKTKSLALLTPDKLTSDGASCSALGACWAKQLSVEPRTERRKP